MNKLTIKGTRWLKTIHLVTVCMWVGGAASLLLILFLSKPANGDELYGVNLAMKMVDDFAIIPGALGNICVGIIYGIWTKWGFFRHRWITVKWIMTIVQALFGTFFLGPWLNSNVAIAARLQDAAFTDPQFLYNQQMNSIFGIIQLSLLVLMVWISVFKPWKSKRHTSKAG